MNSIVTRADGQPAHVRAKPRLRQSHFDALRRLPSLYAEMRAEEATLATDLGEREQPHPLFGTIIAAGLLGILMLTGFCFSAATGGFQ